MQKIDDTAVFIGFSQESRAGGQFKLNGKSGRYDQVDRRPAPAYGVRQLQSAHGTGHLDVREHGADVPAMLQYRDGVVGIGCFQRNIAGILHHLDRVHADERFILDDQDHGAVGGRLAVSSAPGLRGKGRKELPHG